MTLEEFCNLHSITIINNNTNNNYYIQLDNCEFKDNKYSRILSSCIGFGHDEKSARFDLFFKLNNKLIVYKAMTPERLEIHITINYDSI